MTTGEKIFFGGLLAFVGFVFYLYYITPPCV